MPNAQVIILDLDGNGVKTLTANQARVKFDWNEDSFADVSSWIAVTEGFLFFDRDGNGALTNAAEMNFLTDVAGSTNALEGLKAHDTNGDGLFSALDKDFTNFRIWQDANGNGVSESNEILTLPVARVRSINLTSTAVGEPNTSNTVSIDAKGSYTDTTGATRNYAAASVGYVAARKDGLPQLDFAAQSFELKTKKYRITSKDGGIFVSSKYLKTTDSRAGALKGSVDLSFKTENFGLLAPLVLDLDGDGVSLVHYRRISTRFDMNGDGLVDDTGWISKNDGFLVIDRNKDGLITDASELSLLAEDPTAKTSLAGLAALDSNADHIIDSNDARFEELKVWIDGNQNGLTEAGELKTLNELGILSFDLAAHNTTNRVKLGDNIVIATTTFKRDNGMVGTVGDVALGFRPGDIPKEVYGGPPPSAVSAISAAVATAASQFASAIAAFTAPTAVGDISPTTDGAQRFAFSDLTVSAYG
jgi:hypothetical protein